MTADAAIRIVLLTLQGCKLHTHDHRLPPGLATVQEVTARMFTTTLRSQPVYSRSRLSEFASAREPGRINETDSNNVSDRDATSGRWFSCLTGALTYLYDATISFVLVLCICQMESLN